MGHTLFFANPVPVEHVMEAFDRTDEVLTDRQLARQLGMPVADVRDGSPVVQVCAGAYVSDGAGLWRFYSDSEWECEE